ncbi:MAG TPA: hypothetical protein VME24_01945 [Alphaproteobacteria bacterium]|nr:hypothetical protein [Alphaproteobacteria bacterium]
MHIFIHGTYHRFPVARTALAAARQCPISSRCAIHSHVIVVLLRSCLAHGHFHFIAFEPPAQLLPIPPMLPQHLTYKTLGFVPFYFSILKMLHL